MSSWRSERGLQWQPVKLWWTPCPRGLRQCWKIMVATQNIETLCQILTFSLRGVLNFVASSLDINGCVMSYFEGTANLLCYTSTTLLFIVFTTHCSKVSFLQCCLVKIYNKIFTKMWGVYSLLWETVDIDRYFIIFLFWLGNHRIIFKPHVVFWSFRLGNYFSSLTMLVNVITLD